MDFSALSDTDLTRMTARAWRDAARDWQEARSATGTGRTMLLNSAELADAYWRDLRDEQERRLEEAATSIPEDVRSADTYMPVESIAADRVTRPPAAVTSAWVKRAGRHELPTRVTGGAIHSPSIR